MLLEIDKALRAEIVRAKVVYESWAERDVLLDNARKTSAFVKELTKCITERGNITATDFNTIYLMTVWEGRITSKTKKDYILALDLPIETKKKMASTISESIGCWGTGSMNIARFLDSPRKTAKVEQLLNMLNLRNNEAELDRAIKEFADEDIKGMQPGFISNIFYCLHTDRYPVINSAVRVPFKRLTCTKIPDRLQEYLYARDILKEFRDTFSFLEDFRDVDIFFAWLYEPFGDLKAPHKGMLPEKCRDTKRKIRKEKIGDIALKKAEKVIQEIKSFIRGSALSPGDEKLMFWVWFCYEVGMYKEGHQVFRRIDKELLNPDLYNVIRKIALACENKI